MIKLTYFDMDGGRGEPVRIILSAAGVAFEDVRISFEQFGAMRDNTPLGAVPVMEIDGVVYAQTNAMIRYAGHLAGLYPKDPWQAYLCDELMDATEDMIHKTVATFGLEGDELKTARKELTDGYITRYLKLLDTRLAKGEYFSDQRLTVVDIKIFVQLRTFLGGVLDHVPTDVIAKVAPNLMTYYERVANDPIVKNYYSQR